MPAGKAPSSNAAERTVFRPPWVKGGADPTDRPATKPTEKPGSKTADKASTKTADKAATQTADKAATRTADKAATKTVEKPVSKPAEKPVAKVEATPATKKIPLLSKQPPKRDSTSSSSASEETEDSSSFDFDDIEEPVIKFADVQLKKVKPKDPDEIPVHEKEKESPLENVQLRKVQRQPSEREPFRKEKENNPLANVQLRKTSIQKEPQKNGEEKESFFKKPQLKPVPQREKSPPKKDHKIKDLPKLNSVADRKLPERKQSLLRKDSTIEDLEEIDKELPAKRNSLVRAESMRRLSQTPAPPPMPPPPPGMPGEGPVKPLTKKQKQKLDMLKARPKVRPDWSQTLKEIEGGKKLRHVECNDRSQPLLPEAKAQEHFLYASEKPNVHNELLKQIAGGIKLKSVQTNDRSKPLLDGLRKFRRQMTIEEQIQKSISMASMPPEEITPDEVDEMDDIDKVRDDLQSTKQMLALELRNKEAQQMENKRLLARIANLEAELDKAKSGKTGGGGGGNAGDDKVITALKKETEQTRKQSEQMEKKYTEAVKELDTTKLQLEENKRKNIELEKKLQEALSGKRVSVTERKESLPNGDTSDLDFDVEESSEESDGEETEEKRVKKLQKEVNTLRNKLRNFKHKEDNAKKERLALKTIIRNSQLAMKEEKKKYNRLKKEVDKMATLLKDVSEEEDEDEEKEDPAEEEEAEEEESAESSDESETESESDSERSQSEPEDAPPDKKKTNLTSRTKRHENILGALKKANFLLKTNAERLQDDLNKQKELTCALQEDLDSVLSELG